MFHDDNFFNCGAQYGERDRMMGIKRLSWLVGTAVVATLGMQITVQAQGHAVVDISEWQGQLSPSQVQAMKSQVQTWIILI